MLGEIVFYMIKPYCTKENNPKITGMLIDFKQTTIEKLISILENK